MAKDVKYFLTNICCVEWLWFFFKETHTLASLRLQVDVFVFVAMFLGGYAGARTLAFLRWGVTVWVCGSASFWILRVHTLCCPLFLISPCDCCSKLHTSNGWKRRWAWQRRSDGRQCSKVVSLEFFLFKFLLIAETFLVCRSLTLRFFK
jgi:hypothetical protein